MANDLNVVNLIGRLTRDPEVKQLGGGDKSICKFSIANNRSYGGKESVISSRNTTVTKWIGENL